jgi:predicted dinucleotide-binding enzyme
VKAFGTLGAPALAAEAYRAPRRVALFYATDDEVAAAAADSLITAAGFEPVKAGGVEDAARIEVPGGDLHQNGGLKGGSSASMRRAQPLQGCDVARMSAGRHLPNR